MKKAHLHLIKWALEKGYTLDVWGDGEELDYSGTSYKEAKENAEACDTAGIILKENGKEVASFYIVNGLEPEELVSDYTANEIGEAWQKAYDKECYGELCKNK